MRPAEIALSLETLYAARRPAFVQGSPGVGKSQTFRQVADKLGIGLIDLRLSQFDRVDLSGVPYIENGATKWAIPDFWPREGAGIILFDEYNAAPREMQPVSYQVFLDRRLGDWVMPEAWVPFAAGNLETDRAITNKTSTAWNNRVTHLLYEVHLDDWCKWAVENDLPPQLIAFIRFRPNLLHQFDPNAAEKAFPSPRTWEFVGDIIKAKPCAAIEHELFRGTIGTGAAAELSGFLRIWRQLPSIDGILMNPQTAAVPDDPATLFAVAGALARRAGDKNFDRVMTYANRMPKEWATYLVKDAIRRDADLQQTAAFIKWASVNADIMG
jgi:hypothetical protein